MQISQIALKQKELVRAVRCPKCFHRIGSERSDEKSEIRVLDDDDPWPGGWRFFSRCCRCKARLGIRM